MRRRRALPLLGAALATATAILVFACGVDVVGPPAIVDVPEVGPSLPPSLPPKADATTPIEDAALDAPGPPPACPAGAGPSMVLVAREGGSPYCIDATEVSFGQYRAMLDGGVSAPGVFAEAGAPLAAACAPNTSFVPKGAVGDAGAPVVNVSWCDAYAFCRWAGKRLCEHPGNAGTDAGADAGAEAGVASEWGHACTAGGTQTYPYGDNFDAGVCNVSSPGTHLVGGKPSCVGGAPGIFDMSGNVSEWVARCRSTADGGVRCATVGGSYASTTPAQSRCAAVVEDIPTTWFTAWGFRCCATPQ